MLAAVEIHHDGDLVAAQRVLPLGAGVARVERPVAARILVVVEDDLAVEVVAHANVFRDARESVDESVDLLGERVEVEARSGRGCHAEVIHDRLGAVVAGAHGDALAVEDLSDVVGMDTLDLEGDDPATPLGGWPEDPDVRQLGQPRKRVLGQLPLVPLDRVEPDRVQVVDRLTETVGLRDRRRPGLELGGRSAHVVFSAVTLRIIDPPSSNGDIRSEEILAAPEDADPGRREHLVAGEGEDVAAELLDVDRAIRNGLTRIDDHDCVAFVRPRREVCDGIDGSERVRDERACNELHPSATLDARQATRARARRCRRSG